MENIDDENQLQQEWLENLEKQSGGARNIILSRGDRIIFHYINTVTFLIQKFYSQLSSSQWCTECK